MLEYLLKGSMTVEQGYPAIGERGPAQRTRFYRADLRFFDVPVRIRSDSRAFVARFASMYRRFQGKNGAFKPSRSPLELTLVTAPDDRWRTPTMLIDGKAWPLRDPALLEGYAYERFLNEILSRVRAGFLIHAGAVSDGERGLILVADSGCGKTTLTLELVRRGFRFLSDEVAALGRESGLVYPFPRSLRIRPGTLALTGFGQADRSAPRWLGKAILDIQEIVPGRIGNAVPLSTVVVLRDGEREIPAQPQPLGIVVDACDDAFVASVRKLPEVRGVQTGTWWRYPVLRIEADRKGQLLPTIEALCERRGILLLDVIKREKCVPSFASSPLLEPLSKSEGVMALLRQFRGGHKSLLLQEEFEGNSARMFLALADLLGPVACYSLSVGRLHEMGDLLVDLFRSRVGAAVDTGTLEEQ